MKHGTMYRRVSGKGWDTLYRIVGTDTLGVGSIDGGWYVVDLTGTGSPRRAGSVIGSPLPRREEARAVALLLHVRRRYL